MQMNNNEQVKMTLKEVVDILNEDRKRGDEGYIEHNKAMRKVESLMALDEGFGVATKQRNVIPMPNNATKTIETFILNKKQCLAVAASMNSRVLMKVINRIEELEKAAQLSVPQNFAAALRLAADQQEVIEAQQQKILLDAPKVALMDAMEAEELAISIGDWAKLLSKTNQLKIGPNKLMSFLREKGLLMKGRDANERNKPYQILIEAGLFDMKLSATPVGVKVQPLITTKGQTKYSEMVVDNFR